jgi:3-hydroxyisobutyrate dehydrogenase-like beta-hydroxyacid dehydrogenase
MGPSGSGVAMKLVVNALLGVGMQAVAEAVALGSRLDLPRDLLLDTLAKTAVVAPAHIGKLATAKKNDYSPQFPVRLMRKDFGLVLDAAAQLGLSMPTTEAAAAINSEEAEPGIEEDFSAVIRRMEQEAGVEKALPPAA